MLDGLQAQTFTQDVTFRDCPNPTAHESGNPLHSRRSSGNVLSATAARTCGCRRQDRALVGGRETGVNATLAGIHDRGLVSCMFMISACTFAVLLEHPASPVRMSIANSDVRRLLGGIAMGLTALLLIYSPLGRRSGAHM